MATAGTTERNFPDAEAQASALAATIAEAMREAVARRGTASLVLTGGSTPGLLYDRLAAMDLPWKRIEAILSDERWVHTGHPDSNERLVRERLMRGEAAWLGLVSLKSGAETPAAAVGEIEARLKTPPRPFDFVLLGMGQDGHVASLFPGAETPADSGVVSPAVAPDGVQRLSLTYPALADARRIALLIRGEAKRRVWRDAQAGRAPNLPISLLLARTQAPVEVYWAP